MNRVPFSPGDIANHPSSSKSLTVSGLFGRPPEAAVPCFAKAVVAGTTLWADTTPPGVALSGLFAASHRWAGLAAFPVVPTGFDNAFCTSTDSRR